MGKHEQKTVVDILILVALKDELDALLAIDAHSIDSQWIPDREANPPLYWHRKFIDANGVAFSVAAARTTEMRGEAVAALGGKLVAKLKPKAISMCGVCAGPRADVQQGDVIVATELFRYDMGKIVTRITSKGTTEEELFHEIRTYNLRRLWKHAVQDTEGTPGWWENIGVERPISFRLQEHWMREALNEYDMNGGDNPQERNDGYVQCPDWTMVLTRLRNRKEVYKNKLKLTQKGLIKLQQDCQLFRDGPKPDDPMKIQVGPMATVTNVVQDLDENGRARIFNAIRKYQRKTLAIEMEATAVGCVAELDEIPCIVAKSVQDYADQDKDDRYREYAARASARFLIEFFHQHLHLVKGATTPSSSGPPEDPIGDIHEKIGSPIAHPVQTLDNLDYKNLPLDIGTIWGLERGSFIGVVIGNTANQLHETLLRSERALEDALKRSISTINLPKRYWFKVNATLYPSGPSNENELWSACTCEDDRLIEKARMAISQGELLGFIVELSDAVGNPELLASHWVKTLFSDRFPLKQYSIIFCLSSGDNFKKQLIKELRSATYDLPVTIPVETLSTIKQIRTNIELSNTRKQRPMLFEKHEDLSSIGLGIATWIQHLMDTRKTDLGELRKYFNQLWEWLQQVDSSVQQEVANQELVDIEAACRDLRKVFQNETTYDVGRQFLTLCIQRDRSRAGMLLEAAASSPDYQLRREALVASITDDDLVTSWLCGAIYIEEDISNPDFLIADPAPLVDALALATMRLLNGTDPDNTRWHKLLDRLRSKIGIDVEQVYNLCMEKFDEENFWKNCKGQSQLFAVRAGCRLRPSITTLTKGGLQHFPPWWFLMTKEPDSIWLTNYLELRPELRWPLGLVNRKERDILNRQKLLVENVVACRRGRLCAL